MADPLILPDRADDPRPNILWICTDQQRFDTLGCCGNRFVRTPHVDRLAEDGMLFEHAFCQNPLCTPSRGSFLTGRYPITNRLRQNGQRCPTDLRLVTRDLADAGYVGGLAGKFHLSPCDNRLLLGKEWWRHHPQTFYRGAEPRVVPDGYSEFYWAHSTGTHHAASQYAAWVHEQGGEAGPGPEHPRSSHVREGMPSELRHTTWCANKAISFMERHGDRPWPWFFSVNIVDPHPIWDPPPGYLDRYLERLEEIPLPAITDREAANLTSYHRGPSHLDSDRYDENDHRMIRAAYWAKVDHIDEQVGRMLEALDRTGQRENTLVIFMSDHGELLGDHGAYPKGPFLYDCSTRVPLIIRWPGEVAPGQRAAGLVELADLAPTLAEAARLEPDPGMQGQSLVPWLTGERPADRIREDVYCEYLNGNPDRPPVYLTMVRTDTHKIVRSHAGDEGELYDLTADPGEHRNLWNDPAHRDLKGRMLARLSDRLAFTCDPLPERVGVY